MHVLVTGGAGYIGSVTVKYLLNANHQVTVIDDLSVGHYGAISKQAHFFQCNLLHLDALHSVIQQLPAIDCIIHFASHASVGESMTTPTKYFRDNMLNTLNLLEIMREYHVQRFIFSSTCNLFGTDVTSVSAESKQFYQPISENQVIHPGSPYGESKLSIERLLYWYHRAYKLRYICLRYFNAAGAIENLGEDHTPETHLIPLALQVALHKRPHLEIYGNDYPTPDGTCVRDFVHVADLAQAHVLALEQIDALDKMDEHIFHIGAGKGHSVLEVLATCREITGHKMPHYFLPRRKGDPAFLVADISKAKRMLKWQPTYTTLKEIIQSAWEWHTAHPIGY